MSLPGFTAEASVYRSGYSYRATAKGGPAGTAQVVPHLYIDDTCSQRCGSAAVRCGRLCNRMLGDPGLCWDACFAVQSNCIYTCRMFQF